MGRSWQLPRTSKKIKCPGCSKTTFKPYVYSDDNVPVDEYRFGRCDRVNNCGYDTKPGSEDVDSSHKEVKNVYVYSKIFPKDEILKQLKEEPTNLHLVLQEKGIPFQFLYDNGVYSQNGLTAFVFRDIDGKLCNIKRFKYKADGHREQIKDGYDSYSLKQPENKNPYIKEYYPMPLFGEHQLDPDKKKITCIVESEKTKIIAQFHYPEFDWVASGSANGLSDGSDGTADKITPLKGRIVYWVCDNDPAARGKFKQDDKGNSIWVDCSSVRNGKKLIEQFHIVDLFTDKVPGYDLGDALLDGLKPEIKPTWSKYHTHRFYQSYVAPSDYRIQKELASQIGETSGISAEFDNTFSWMRTHVNGFYGWSNDGKGVMSDFLSLMKSKKSGWKHCMFKQEDMGAYFNDGESKLTADRIYAKQAWTLTGLVPPPFEAFAKKHSLLIMTDEKYHESMEWVRKHFFIVNPKDRKYRNIFDEFLFFHECFGIDHFEIDPWNTILLDEMDRGDERLVQAFIAAKEFVLKTNTVMSIINHAGSKHEPKEKNGAFKVVNQFMQLGGSAWDMKMDGQFSTHRPLRHKDPNDPRVHFYNLKQRDSEIVGAEKGVYKKIEFDRNLRQYFFDGVNPVDGSKKQPMVETQADIPYTPSWKKNKKGKDVGYEQHLQNDWGTKPSTDDPPF